MESRPLSDRELFERVLDAPRDRRDAVLDAECPDPPSRARVRALLDALDQAGDAFLGSPAVVLTTAATGRTGRRLGAYRIERELGRGGMGAVYLATRADDEFDKHVAIKIVAAPLGDDTLVRRFLRERQILAQLEHPHIARLLDGGTIDDGLPYLVMELVDGVRIDQYCRDRALPIVDRLRLFRLVCDAVQYAHTSLVVHRDLKPQNILVTADSQPKLLDFGIAALVSEDGAGGASTTLTGQAAMTPDYASPEQMRGERVTAASDIYSLGVLLYELLTGTRPHVFAGRRPDEIYRILTDTEPTRPSAVAASVGDAPLARRLRGDLDAIVMLALRKDPRRRYASVAQLSDDVRRYVEGQPVSARGEAAAYRAMMFVRRHKVGVAAALAVTLVAAAAGSWWMSGREAREARHQVPELLALAQRYELDAFFRAARHVVPLVPEDRQLKQEWLNMTMLASIGTTPPGAEVAVKGYGATHEPWIPIGTTPLEQVRVPFGPVRVSIRKDGYAPLEVTLNSFDPTFTLDRIDDVPIGMVRVTATSAVLEGTALSLPDFWMDRYEVTNREFKAFVDAGGYRSRDHWQEPFVDAGRTLPWEEAMGRFRDRTGRHGPSEWEFGTYPTGQDAFPVAGVSWYEAAAYAVFAGKTLPTAYQWRGAAGYSGFGANFWDILPSSNFGLKGPAEVGSHPGLATYGTYDMAGNVKEWTWNESAGGRMILGGGWNEPTYMFDDRDAQPAFRRLATYGFRLVKNIEAQPSESYQAVNRPTASDQPPVSDAAFAILAGLYRYDPLALDAKVDAVEEAPDWRRETVSFATAYGDRMMAHLYLPKSAAPPYQSVIHFPDADAQLLRSSRDLRLILLDFVIHSGRALIFPIYQGTYERSKAVRGMNEYRDLVIARVKDFRRVLEFIDSRPDLDQGRIGYHGISLGAYTGVIISGLDTRLKASVLVGGGLASVPFPPEVNPINFAPRITVPTLMVNGRDDFSYPLEASQLRLFRQLGPPADRKRHAVLEGGHIPLQIHEVMREVLGWFDRYLGPVTVRTTN